MCVPAICWYAHIYIYIAYKLSSYIRTQPRYKKMKEVKISELYALPKAHDYMHVAVVDEEKDTVRVNTRFIANLVILDVDQNDVGLDAIDNVSDELRPVTMPQQHALDLESDAGHIHDIIAFTDLAPSVKSVVDDYQSVVVGNVNW